MSTWWQVYVNGTVFGFKTMTNFKGQHYIADHPEHKWKGVYTPVYKKWLEDNKAEIYKIADVNN